VPTLGVGIDARKATVGAREASRAIGKIRKETTMLEKQQKLLAGQMVKTGAATKGMGMGMGRMFTGLMAVGAVVKMVKTWGSFEDALMRVKGVTGGTEKQMAALQERARQLGAATSFTATQSAEGMLMLSRAGMSTNEVIVATGAVLDMAKVAGIGLQESATLVADSLKMFAMEAGEARHAADVLAKAANLSNTNITQLGEGLKMAGPLANAAGMSLEDASVMLGVLADNGLKATLGGTGVRAMLASLTGPSDAAQEALQRLGIDMETLSQKVQTKGGLLEVMKQLGPAVMDVEDAIKIFSRRGATAALVLAGQSDRWEKLNSRMEDANGTVRTSAALIEQSLGDAFKQLGSAIEESVHQIGEKGLSGALKGLIHWLTEGIRVLGEFSAGMTKAGAVAAGLIVTLGAGGLAGAISKMVVKFIAAKKAAGGFFLLLRAHPIIAAVTAVGALVTGIISLTDKAKFSTDELINFNRAINNMTANTANLVDQWRVAEEVGGAAQFDKKAQLIAGLQGQVTTLMGEAIKVREVGGKMSSEKFKDLAAAVDRFGLAGGVELKLKPRKDQYAPGFKQVPADEVVAALKSLIERLESLKGLHRTKAALAGDPVADISEKVKTASVKDAEKARVAKLIVDKNDILAASMLELERQARLTNIELKDGANARAREEEVMQIANRVKKMGINMTHDEADALKAVMKATHDKIEADEKQKQKLEEQKQFAGDIANAMVNPLVEALQSGDWSNVGKTILAQLQAALITEHISKPLIGAITGALASGAAETEALGGVYSGGIKRFARGGIVGGTTMFGTRGGLGVMGEAGPEAIMPLRRGPGGRLGVEAQGGGSVVNDNRTINIQVSDDAGFRRTMRQLDRDTSRRLERGMHA
jgi:TP901 family phage tail tape measure protein